MTDYKYQVGLLVPFANMGAANQAAFDLAYKGKEKPELVTNDEETGEEIHHDDPNLHTFTEDNVVVDSQGNKFCISHSAFRDVTFEELDALKTQLSGDYLITYTRGERWEKVADFWEWIESKGLSVYIP